MPRAACRVPCRAGAVRADGARNRRCVAVGRLRLRLPVAAAPHMQLVCKFVVTTRPSLHFASRAGMQPYQQIDASAPFASAFRAQGATWMAIVVSFGSLFGIADTIVVVQYSMVRRQQQQRAAHLCVRGWHRRAC